jgi:hypothetical protein
VVDFPYAAGYNLLEQQMIVMSFGEESRNRARPSGLVKELPPLNGREAHMSIRQISRGAIILPLYLFLALSCSAWAETFDVSNVSAFQSALDSATSNGENDTINVAAGSYDVTSTLTFYSTEDFHILIAGAGMGVTTLDGGDTVQILNIRTTPANAHVTVENITFQNGYESTYGGGLCVQTDQASITLENSEFNDNTAMAIGGGASAVSTTGDISISDCFFRRNSGEDDAGGLNAGSSDGVISLTSSIFEDNTVPGVFPGVPAKDGGGAILYIDGTGQIVMTGNTFNRNTAADGGGGCMTYFVGSGVSAIINNNSFNSNTAQLDGGGCFTRINDNGMITYNGNNFSGNSTVTAGGAGSMIYLNDGDLDYSGNTYTDNTSAEDGGGAWIWNGTGTLTITGNTFTGNDAANNGGGASVVTDSSTVIFARNVLDSNIAASIGGGLSYATGNGTLNLYHNTFYGNQASDGGGIYFYLDQSNAQASVFNNILWHDTSPAVAMSGATSTIATYSDIESGTGEPWFGVGCIDEDPLFADPVNGDFHLSWDSFPIQDSTKSPCIDSGDPASPEDPDSTTADMGAFYYDQFPGVSENPQGECSAGTCHVYPNPFTRKTVIQFRILKGENSRDLRVHIYGLAGQVVKRPLADD